MKKTIPVIVGICIVSGCYRQESMPVEDAGADRAAVEAVWRQMIDGIHRGDSAPILQALADDTVMMAPDANPLIGKEAVGAWVEAAFVQPQPDNRYGVDDIHVSGDLAILYGPFFEGIGKYMWIYERQADGHWRVRYSIWNNNSPSVTAESAGSE